jgi:predicted transcriptional regulator
MRAHARFSQRTQSSGRLRGVRRWHQSCLASVTHREATMQSIDAHVSEFMKAPVLTIEPEARAEDVLVLARTSGVHHFPIVAQDKLVGIVCTCDLQDLSADARVLQVAWRHVVTLPLDGTVGDAARLMALQGVGSIVVLDARGICGIVTRDDLARANTELDRLLLEARCASCGARHHLRPASNGRCICQDCRNRAGNSD